MPIYEFICQGCNTKFEELVFRQDEIRHLACPACQGTDYRRILSRFGFRSGGENPSASGSSCSSCTASSCAGCR